MTTTRRTILAAIATAAVALLLTVRTYAATEPAPHMAGEAPHAVVAHETAAAAKGAHGEGEEAVNPLPDPTDPDTYWSAVWVLIIFVVLLIILYPTAWKNVLAGLKAREQKIRQDIADAEAARAKAEATLKEYSAQLATAEGKIREMLTKAAADAEKLATNLRMQAQQEAEEIKERSQREIEAARKAAVTDIYAQAAELSTGIAEKILRRSLNVEDQRDLVSRSLEQMQAAGKA